MEISQLIYLTKTSLKNPTFPTPTSLIPTPTALPKMQIESKSESQSSLLNKFSAIQKSWEQFQYIGLDGIRATNTLCELLWLELNGKEYVFTHSGHSTIFGFNWGIGQAPRSSTPPFTLKFPSNSIISMSPGSKSFFIVTTATKIFKVSPIKSDEIISTDSQPVGTVFCNDSRLVYATNQHVIAVNIDSGKELWSVDASKCGQISTIVALDGIKMLCCGTQDGNLLLVNKSGIVELIPAHLDAISSLSAQNSVLAAGSADFCVSLWSYDPPSENLGQLSVISRFDAPIQCVSLCPHGKFLASSTTGKEIVASHSKNSNDLEMEDNRNNSYATLNSHIDIAHVPSGYCLYAIPYHGKAESLSWSPTKNHFGFVGTGFPQVHTVTNVDMRQLPRHPSDHDVSITTRNSVFLLGWPREHLPPINRQNGNVVSAHPPRINQPKAAHALPLRPPSPRNSRSTRRSPHSTQSRQRETYGRESTDPRDTARDSHRDNHRDHRDHRDRNERSSERYDRPRRDSRRRESSSRRSRKPT